MLAVYLLQTQTTVVGYIPCRKIIRVQRIDERLTKHKLSFQIMAKNKQQLVCLPCEEVKGALVPL